MIRLSTANNFFELNGNTGELRSIQSIDRELLEDSTIALLAVAANGSTPPIEILIEVTDINDNAPVFPDTASATLEILESIEIGSQVISKTLVKIGDKGKGHRPTVSSQVLLVYCIAYTL